MALDSSFLTVLSIFSKALFSTAAIFYFNEGRKSIDVVIDSTQIMAHPLTVHVTSTKLRGELYLYTPVTTRNHDLV